MIPILNNIWKKYLILILLFFFFILIIIHLQDLFFGIIMALFLDHWIEILENLGLNKYFSIIITMAFISVIIMLLLLNFLPFLINNMIVLMINLQTLVDYNDYNFFQFNVFVKTINFKPIIMKILNYIKTYYNLEHFNVQLLTLMQKININNMFFVGSMKITNILVGFFSTIFLARSLLNNLLKHSNDKQKTYLIEYREKIKTFIFYQMIIGSCNGLFFGFLTSFFALNGSMFITLFVFLSSLFLPSFGCLIGLLMSLIMMIVQQYGVVSLILGLFFFSIPYLLENYILIPKLICEDLNINYLILIIGLFSTTKLLGFKYLLFTVPIIIFIQFFIKYFNNILSS